MVCWSAISHTSHSPCFGWDLSGHYLDGSTSGSETWPDGKQAQHHLNHLWPEAGSCTLFCWVITWHLSHLSRKKNTFPSEFLQKMKMMKDILNLLASFAIGSNLSPTRAQLGRFLSEGRDCFRNFPRAGSLRGSEASICTCTCTTQNWRSWSLWRPWSSLLAPRLAGWRMRKW